MEADIVKDTVVIPRVVLLIGELVMISIEEAVQAARGFAERLYSEGELKQLRVEEIESSKDDSKWFVTLGWVEPAVQQVGGFAALSSTPKIQPLPRVYKTFTVDTETGHVESMKMRE